jgi:arylsulfatase A
MVLSGTSIIMKQLLVILLTILTFKGNSQKPNIIVVLVDDLGFETITYNGGQSYSTPNIDLFASQSLCFINAHAMPKCAPSRVELLTGKYNFRNYTTWGAINDTTIANVLKEQGYTTGIFGKWQLGKGDSILKTCGFDEYAVTQDSGSRYKNPSIYSHGKWIEGVQGKYGEDVIRDSLFRFIEQNQTIPFFAYYSMLNVHQPFSPTPDDSVYSTWNGQPSPIYFPSMVKYMDKTFGQLVDKIECMGLSENTIIMFLGDNGTPQQITSQFKGTSIKGGKGLTIKYGTNVPLYVRWKGRSITGFDSNLIDLTDVYATISELAGLQEQKDGVSFVHNIQGLPGSNKQYLYFDYKPMLDEDGSADTTHSIWVMDKKYKLYDSIVTPSKFRAGKFYNYQKKPTEGQNTHIDATERSSYETHRYRSFKNVIDSIKSTYLQ